MLALLNRRWLAALMVLIGITSTSHGADAIAAQSGFVTVKGKHFLLDGKPYYYAGANLWYGMYLGSPGRTGNRARLIKELDQSEERRVGKEGRSRWSPYH